VTPLAESAENCAEVFPTGFSTQILHTVSPTPRGSLKVRITAFHVNPEARLQDSISHAGAIMRIPWSTRHHKRNAILKVVVVLSTLYFMFYACFLVRHWLKVSDVVDALRADGDYVYVTATVPVPPYAEWYAQTPWSELQCIDTDSEMIDIAFLYNNGFTTCLTEIGIRKISECDDNTAVALSQITSLEMVNVEYTSVTGRGVAALSTLPRLAILNVMGCRVDDASLESLCRCRNLKNLFLAHTHVTDRSTATISRIKTLEVIDISGTAIGDVGLASLISMPSLRELDVRQSRVSHRGIAEFIRARPDVSITQDTHAEVQITDSCDSQCATRQPDTPHTLVAVALQPSSDAPKPATVKPEAAARIAAIHTRLEQSIAILTSTDSKTIDQKQATLIAHSFCEALLYGDSTTIARAFDYLKTFPRFSPIDFSVVIDEELSDNPRARSVYALTYVPHVDRLNAWRVLPPLLLDNDPGVRAGAIFLSLSCNDPYLTLSICRLMQSDRTAHVRSAAISVAGWVGTLSPHYRDGVRKIIVNGLHDANPKVQFCSACWISSHPFVGPNGFDIVVDTSAVRAIRRAMLAVGVDAGEQDTFVKVLQYSGKEAKAALPEIRTLLQSVNPVASEQEIWLPFHFITRLLCVLGNCGTDAKQDTKLLNKFIQCQDEEISITAAATLVRIAPATYPAWRNQLIKAAIGDGKYQTLDYMARQAALNAIFENSPSERLSLLRNLLDGSDNVMQRLSIRKLGPLVDTEQQIQDLFRNCLEDNQYACRMRVDAASALLIATQNPVAFRFLDRTARERSAESEERSTAAQAADTDEFYELERPTEFTAVAGLGNAAGHQATAAALTLGSIVRNEEDEYLLRVLAAEAIQRLGAKGAPAVPLLIETIQDESSLQIRPLAIRTIGAVCDTPSQVVKVLLTQCITGNYSEKVEAIGAMVDVCKNSLQSGSR